LPSKASDINIDFAAGASGAPPSARLSDAYLPSLGSIGHDEGICKPCAFHMKAGMACRNGADCVFCHVCEVGEKKRRKKERRAVRTAERMFRRMALL
jgi:hypothetical protein